MHKSFIFVIIISLLTTGICFAQGEEEDTESITISTYYPAPAGVYKQMRLHPSDDIEAADCNANNEGAMYYDDSSNQAFVCRETAPTIFAWEPVGGRVCGNFYDSNPNGTCEGCPPGWIAEYVVGTWYACVDGGFAKRCDPPPYMMACPPGWGTLTDMGDVCVCCR